MAAVKKEAVKEVVKAAETAVEKKETVKTAASKTAAAKSPAEKKAPAARKAPAKKAEPKETVVIEYAGSQIVAKDVLEAATKAYKENHKGVVIKTIEVYIQPEEKVAYYVVNGEGSEDFKVSL